MNMSLLNCRSSAAPKFAFSRNYPEYINVIDYDNLKTAHKRKDASTDTFFFRVDSK